MHQAPQQHRESQASHLQSGSSLQQGDGPALSRSTAEPGRSRKINVHDAERVASIIAGTWLVARSLQPARLHRAPGALAGAAFLVRGLTGHCHTYAALGVSTAPNGAPAEPQTPAVLELTQSITVGRTPEELYRLWLAPGTLAQAFAHFSEIESAGDGTSRWRVQGPLRQRLEYSTRVVEQREPELVRWESEPGSGPGLKGAVSFKRAPADWGTEVSLHMSLQPPAGRLGVMLAKLLGPAPKLLVQKGLRRFKSLAETGEVPTLTRNPAARDLGRDETNTTRRA
jgi:uncharacterized membrane protein